MSVSQAEAGSSVAAGCRRVDGDRARASFRVHDEVRYHAETNTASGWPSLPVAHLMHFASGDRQMLGEKLDQRPHTR